MLLRLQNETEHMGPRCWPGTVAFYAALHCMDAYLTSLGVPGTIHHLDRQHKLERTSLPGPVADAYRILKNLSEDERYRLATFDEPFIRTTVLDKY